MVKTFFIIIAALFLAGYLKDVARESEDIQKFTKMWNEQLAKNATLGPYQFSMQHVLMCMVGSAVLFSIIAIIWRSS